MHDTIVEYHGALSRKGIKPVMLDLEVYLRKGKKNWEEESNNGEL